MSQVKIKVSVGTRKVGSRTDTEIEIDAEDWEDMSEEEREQFCMEAMFEMIDWDWKLA